ncbi:ATP-binding protein [Streptomyces chiangmaiensis]
MGWARGLPLNSGGKVARDRAREHLESLGWTECAPQRVDSVLVTVSQLVTNAHVHAHSSTRLVLTWDTRCLYVVVHDAASDLPARRPPGTERLGGRGLSLVDALADDWYARPCPGGKIVHACFRPPASARDADDS